MSLAPMSEARERGAPISAAQLTQPQKVAAVMLALGSKAAEALLQQMPETDVEQIAQEIVNLRSLSPDELMGVLEEFHTEARAHRFIVTGGEHHARELLRSLRGDDADAIVDRLMATKLQTPFGFLTFFTPETVARELRDEHPQTVTVVLAHLPTRMAAQVLSALPETTRADVAMRLATLEPSPPEIVARVEQSLRARLGDSTSPAITAKGEGLRELASILNNSDEQTSQSILDSIEEMDEHLAKEIRANMFVFDDLATLADRDLQEVLRQIETAQLALAMKGLEGHLHDLIMGNLSERARQALNEERELLGPVKTSEVKAARTEIAAHVRQLVEEGTVTVLRGDGSDVVA